jgi:hypothetical protein
MQAAELGERQSPEHRLEMHPVADDHIGMCLLYFEAVIVDRCNFVDRQVFGVAEIEDRVHTRLAEILCHLGIASVDKLSAPGVLQP